MLTKLSLNLLKAYQRFIRIMLPRSCRFVPTCSEYAQEAIVKYGFFKGVLKGTRRLLSCHPFSGKSGEDPLA